jgi:protein-disulfide isomerase
MAFKTSLFLTFSFAYLPLVSGATDITSHATNVAPASQEAPFVLATPAPTIHKDLETLSPTVEPHPDQESGPLHEHTHPEPSLEKTDSPQSEDSFKKKIKEVLFDIFEENGEEILDIIQTSVKKKEDKEYQQLADKFSKEEQEQRSSSIFYWGKPDKPIKLFVFFDPLCGHCKAIESLLPSFQEYFTDMSIAFYQWSFLGEESELCARLNHAAWKLDPTLFEKFQKSLLTLPKKSTFTHQKMLEVAKTIGYKQEDLKKLSKSEEVTASVERHRSFCEKTLMLAGTPTLFLQTPAGTFYLKGRTYKELFDEIQNLIPNSAKEEKAAPMVNAPHEGNNHH